MKKLYLGLAGVLVLAGLLVAVRLSAQAEGGQMSFMANLGGYQEVPSINTTANGVFMADITPTNDISYTLMYNGFTSDATAAHIHFAERGVSGGVVAFLCGGGTAPMCPTRAGRVQGMIRSADILALPSQGINAGDIMAVIRAMRFGATYVNVHSVSYPGGELRGQIGRGR